MSIKVCFNEQSQRVFDLLPETEKARIILEQQKIQDAVWKLYPGLRATSGFRCVDYDKTVSHKVPYKPVSRHIGGNARDFSLPSVVHTVGYVLELKLYIYTESDHLHCYLRFS